MAENNYVISTSIDVDTSQASTKINDLKKSIAGLSSKISIGATGSTGATQGQAQGSVSSAIGQNVTSIINNAIGTATGSALGTAGALGLGAIGAKAIGGSNTNITKFKTNEIKNNVEQISDTPQKLNKSLKDIVDVIKTTPTVLKNVYEVLKFAQEQNVSLLKRASVVGSYMFKSNEMLPASGGVSKLASAYFDTLKYSTKFGIEIGKEITQDLLFVGKSIIGGFKLFGNILSGAFSIISSGFNFVFDVISGIGKGLLVAGGALIGAIYAVNKILQSASEQETLRKQLVTIGKGSELGGLTSISKETGVDLKEIVKTVISLSSVGINASDRVLKTIINTSMLYGQDMQSITDLLKKAKAGQIEKEGMSRFGLTQSSLEAQGIKFDKTGQMLQQSKGMLMTAVLGALSNATVGATELMNDTYNGQLKLLINNFKLSFDNLFQGILPYATQFLESINRAITTVFSGMQTIDWKGIGEQLVGFGLNLANTIKNIDFKSMLEGINSVIEKITAVAGTLFDIKGWQELLKVLSTTFTNFVNYLILRMGNWLIDLSNKLLEVANKVITAITTKSTSVLSYDKTNEYATDALSKQSRLTTILSFGTAPLLNAVGRQLGEYLSDNAYTRGFEQLMAQPYQKGKEVPSLGQAVFGPLNDYIDNAMKNTKSKESTKINQEKTAEEKAENDKREYMYYQKLIAELMESVKKQINDAGELTRIQNQINSQMLNELRLQTHISSSAVAESMLA